MIFTNSVSAAFQAKIYIIEHSESLDDPGSWVMLGVRQADALGEIVIEDASLLQKRFYRVISW